MIWALWPTIRAFSNARYMIFIGCCYALRSSFHRAPRELEPHGNQRPRQVLHSENFLFVTLRCMQVFRMRRDSGDLRMPLPVYRPEIAQEVAGISQWFDSTNLNGRFVYRIPFIHIILSPVYGFRFKTTKKMAIEQGKNCRLLRT